MRPLLIFRDQSRELSSWNISYQSDIHVPVIQLCIRIALPASSAEASVSNRHQQEFIIKNFPIIEFDTQVCAFLFDKHNCHSNNVCKRAVDQRRDDAQLTQSRGRVACKGEQRSCRGESYLLYQAEQRQNLPLRNNRRLYVYRTFCEFYQRIIFLF